MKRKKRRSPLADKVWIPLVADGEKPFDQTNGVVDFDVPDPHDAKDVEGDLMGKAVASNTVNVGFFGGGGGF